MLTETVPGTRQELASHLQGLFLEGGLVDRDDLVRQLQANDAPPALVQMVVERVPEDARMANLRAVWQYLPDVPVG